MITTKQGTKIQLNTIEEAIADIKQGKVIIVVDDEDRENEAGKIQELKCPIRNLLRLSAARYFG